MYPVLIDLSHFILYVFNKKLHLVCMFTKLYATSKKYVYKFIQFYEFIIYFINL